ncbi:hypothetical protein CHS0354_007353 [Potamilus streckersoni]|uniref:Uncharacterized protein n=1 Tax=Potamilus streckersoni TaxID=2493646 RepID=A0AAE0RUD8_9BIVA|nr:hypothetical protein CHS0354_007353 [Potamilus streckersoni]
MTTRNSDNTETKGPILSHNDDENNANWKWGNQKGTQSRRKENNVPSGSNNTKSQSPDDMGRTSLTENSIVTDNSLLLCQQRRRRLRKGSSKLRLANGSLYSPKPRTHVNAPSVSYFIRGSLDPTF